VSNTLTLIRKLREFCQYPQAAVAEHLGITQTAYSRLENGQTRLDIERIEQIAGLYGLSTADLMTKDVADLIKQLLDDPNHNSKGGGGNW